MKVNRRFVIPGVTALTLIVVAIAVVVEFSNHGRSSHAVTSGRDLHADHPTYDSLNNIVGLTDAVFSGTVLSAATGSSIPGPSGDGTTADAIPQTDYAVRVDQVFKGSVAAGQAVTVTLAGGNSDGTPVEVEGVPNLSAGEQYVFFLSTGNDGHYYALAGGAAIASKNADGLFALPSEVSQSGTLMFTTDQLAAVPPPDHVLVMLLSQPLVQVDGDVQSGSVSVSRTNGAPTGITGTALIAGRVITFGIRISGTSGTGTFALDGVSYTLQSGVVTPGQDHSVAISGKAKSSAGVQEVRLQVFDR